MAYMSMGEAHRRLSEYVNEFTEAIASQNGVALKRLLAISSNSPYRESVASALQVFKDVSRLVKQVDKYAQLSDMLLQHMRCMQSFHYKQYIDAYYALEKSANTFLQEFRNWETAWAVDALYMIAYEMRTVAEMADREMAANGKNPDKLKVAGSFLMKVFGSLVGKGPKRLGALYVTCQLFKVYFKLGTVHLCRSVIRSIETARVFDFEEFPTRDKVTYMYYTGRLEVFNDNFNAADQKLMYALVHCDPQKEANIRMILKYLVPVKLSLGILPKEWLLQKYKLLEVARSDLQGTMHESFLEKERNDALGDLHKDMGKNMYRGYAFGYNKIQLVNYIDVVRALRTGDLRLLRHALQNHEDQFLRSGVYLVLEKLELQVYQRLIKKIYIMQKQKDPTKAHQVKMDIIVKALKWLEIDMDVEEVECIMAILIHKNLMKGYFSHKSKVVVLSKQDPFPKLSGRPVNP